MSIEGFESKLRKKRAPVLLKIKPSPLAEFCCDRPGATGMWMFLCVAALDASLLGVTLLIHANVH